IGSGTRSTSWSYVKHLLTINCHRASQGADRSLLAVKHGHCNEQTSARPITPAMLARRVKRVLVTHPMLQAPPAFNFKNYLSVRRFDKPNVDRNYSPRSNILKLQRCSLDALLIPEQVCPSAGLDR